MCTGGQRTGASAFTFSHWAFSHRDWRACAASRHRRARALRMIRPLGQKRAQGRPGAGRTHGPRANEMHGAGTTGTSRTTGLPCAMGYGLLRALPGDRALLPPSPQGARCALQELGISVGMPGPHGLAVRIDVVRPPANSALQLRLRPPHPAFNARDDRETPLFKAAGWPKRCS